MKQQEQSWRAINRRLRYMGEDELQSLLDAEVVGQRRTFVAERLHQRLSALRASRERRELMEKLDVAIVVEDPPQALAGGTGSAGA